MPAQSAADHVLEVVFREAALALELGHLSPAGLRWPSRAVAARTTTDDRGGERLDAHPNPLSADATAAPIAHSADTIPGRDGIGGRYGDARSPANAAAATSAIVLQVAARERQRPPPPTPPASPSSPPPAIRRGIVALNIPRRIARHTNVTATNLVPKHRTFQHRRDNLAHQRRPLVLGSGPRRLSLPGDGGAGATAAMAATARTGRRRRPRGRATGTGDSRR